MRAIKKIKLTSSKEPFFLLVLLILVSSCNRKQTTTKSLSNTSKATRGHIYTKNKEPLIGAFVINKSTQQQVVTDTTGFFHIKTQEKDILVFQYIGFVTKEILIQPLPQQDSIQVFLNEDIIVLKYEPPLARRIKKPSIFIKFWREIKKPFRRKR